MNFCDLEKLAQPGQWSQIRTAMQLAADTRVIHSYNHCLDIVNGAGGAVSFADLVLQFGLPPGTVPLAQHYLSCICGDVNYGSNPSDNDPTAPHDGGSPGITQYAIDQTIFEIYRNVYQREPSNKELVWAREAFGRGLSYVAVRAAVITRAISDIYAHVYGRGPSEVDLAREFTDFERGLAYATVEEKVIVEKRRTQALLMILDQYVTAGLSR